MSKKERNVKPESAYRHFHLKANACENVCCTLQQQYIRPVPDNLPNNRIIHLF